MFTVFYNHNYLTEESCTDSCMKRMQMEMSTQEQM